MINAIDKPKAIVELKIQGQHGSIKKNYSVYIRTVERCREPQHLG